jgi:aminopeptidase N
MYALRVRQQTAPTPGEPVKAALPIPLRIGFLAPSGAILAAKRAGEDVARMEHELALTEAETVFHFHGLGDRPIVAPLRGFPAPVTLVDDVPEADRLVQMAEEPDAFTRWEAGQTLARAAIIARAAGKDVSLDGFAAALGRELDRASRDAAFAALALRLPDLPELIQVSPTPDPDALHLARGHVRVTLARALKPKLLPLATATMQGPFEADAASAGRRALKSAALDLLAALGGETAHVLVSAFAEAKTMTEMVAALDALGASDAAQFDAALDIFYQRWRAAPLVLDKWFSIQAAAARPESIDRVRALKRHPDFDLRNPNRVRALAMSFATRNPRAFHAADGSGYAFLAGLALEADRLNPALAARLLGPFETWRRMDSGRQRLAEATLAKLAAEPGLSRNAAEIIARTRA